MKGESVRIEVRIESREFARGVDMDLASGVEQGVAVLWSGTAHLVEPGRRPFEVIDSVSCRDAASQEECVRRVVLALQRRIENVFGAGNRYEDVFRTKLRELESQGNR